MREFKFRAWVLGEMAYPRDIHFEYGPPKRIKSGGILIGQLSGVKMDCFKRRDLRLANSVHISRERLDKDMHIMQFTGFFDKNDVEIYEGDIIECEIIENCFGIYEVIFERGRFTVRDHPYGAGWNPFTKLLCTVIGNIHNNMELLPECYRR